MSSRDRVFLRDLRVHTVIGVSERERARRQVVRVDLDLWTDTRPAGRSDDLADTVDYAAVAAVVTAHATGSRHRLVESLAEDIARLCLARFAVARVRVRITKPAAVPAAGGVGVCVERRRETRPGD